MSDFDHRLLPDADAAQAIVLPFYPGSPEFALQTSADELAAAYARQADPAGYWDASERLLHWADGIHNAAKRSSAARIDRFSVDTDNGWDSVPGAPQAIFLQLHPSSPNFVAGDRQACCLIYLAPDEARIFNGKSYSYDFGPDILGVVRWYASSAAARADAKALRQACRDLGRISRSRATEPEVGEDDPLGLTYRRPQVGFAI